MKKKQLDIYYKMGIKIIYFKKETSLLPGEKEEPLLDILIKTMNSRDTLVVYELKTINKSIVELADFFKRIRQRGIKLHIVSKGDVFKEFEDDTFMDIILEISSIQKAIARERTRKGLEIAREKGRIGGRPKISEETVNRIKYLFYNKKMTLREVAEECSVSLGTAYKYVNT